MTSAFRRAARTIAGIAASSFIAGGCAVAGGEAFVADDKTCTRAERTELGWLDAAAWRPLEKYIRVCKVANGPASPALLLISVWADLYYADKPGGSATIAMPKPLLFTPGGKPVGELPVNFPSDPPAELTVRFTDWQRGLPQEIGLCVVSPAASGDQPLPSLKYDPATQRYRNMAGPRPIKSSGGCDGK